PSRVAQPALRPDRGEGPIGARRAASDPDRLGRPLAAHPHLQLPPEPRDRPPHRVDPVQPRPDHPGGSGPADDGPDRPRSPRAARRDLMDRTMSQDTEDLWSVGRLLNWTTDFLKRKGSESPRLDAEVLLAHALQWERVQLYTHFEDE